MGIYFTPQALFSAWTAAVLLAQRANGNAWLDEGGGFESALHPRHGKVYGYRFTGTHHPVKADWGFDQETEGLASVLGFPHELTASEPDEWCWGTRAPSGWWTSDMPVAVDEGDFLDEEVVQTRALSGYRQTSFLSGPRQLREIRIDLLLARHMWRRAEVLPGESFESTVWPHRHHIRYFSDRTQPASAADYVITEPLGQLRPARYQDREDVARYVLALEMERLVEGSE